MSAFKFENMITTGNVLTMLGMLAGVFMAYGAVQTRISALEQRDAEILRQYEDDRSETLRVRPEVETRLRTLEARFGATLVEVQGLQEDIDELKASLRETNAQLREVATLLRQANGAKP